MRALSFVALCAIGCGGTLPDDFKEEEARCEANLPPEAPVVASPFPGSDTLLMDEIVISASPFRDEDGDTQGGAEVEIWAASPSGVMTTRLWSASFASMPPRVTLADGIYDLGLDSLQDDSDYATRVRYRDARDPIGEQECAQWGAWSEPRYFSTDNGSRALFDDTRMQDVYLEIPPESWGPINAEARPPGCVPYKRNYYKGAITIGGQRFDDVGLRSKGGCGSARNLGGKSNFRVNLEWDDLTVPGCPSRRRFAGQRTFTFNNGVQDRTAGHERVAYEFYHAMGVASSRAVSVRMHVNGTYWGVYQMLEPVERSMLKRWFKSNGGMLYEGTYWCDIVSGNLPVGDVDNKCLTRKFHPTVCDGEPDPGDDPQTYDPLRSLVAKLDGLQQGGSFYPEAKAFLDVDAFLALWAADSVLDNWDSYSLNIVNNYRIYHDPGVDLWYIIPSGVDQTQVGDGINPFGPANRIGQMCWADPDCKPLFAAKLREAAAVFESMDFVDRAQGIHDQIRADIMTDPRKEYDMNTWENANTNWRNWIRTRPQQIRNRLNSAGFPGP